VSQSTSFAATAPILALLALAACTSESNDPRTEPPLVRTAVATGANAPGHSFTGVVTARVQSDLGFRVPGKITERLVDTGQSVRRGQPLMRLDRTDLALATTARSGTVAAAQAKAIQTAADERRYRDLVSAGAVSASAYDQAKAAADAARAELRAAQAQENVAQNEAGYALLRADADGVVVETLAEPGHVVAAGQTVVKLAHAGPREALVELPETVRPRIGSLAQATVFRSGEASDARLRELSDAADPATRTFAARYVLGGRAAQAPLGATVSVGIADDRAVGGQQVPLSAIYDRGRGPGVWVLAASTRQVHWRPVRVGAIGEETATVVEGLRSDERFVTLGAHLLHDDQLVRTMGAAR
jgi:RND family efflux transporter MFP subunit